MFEKVNFVFLGRKSKRGVDWVCHCCKMKFIWGWMIHQIFLCVYSPDADYLCSV